MVVQCRLCGAAHVSCGPVSTAIPVTPDNASRKAPYTMADLKIYTYLLNGVTVTVKLSPEDARLLGATEVKPKPAPAVHAPLVAEKARPEVANAARTAPPNKAR